MCLIYVAWRRHPRFRLVVAANRDEFHVRPSLPAHWWEDESAVLAGRDLQAGGTWLGITSNGRFSALTNHRDPAVHLADARSRGALVSEFLSSDDTAPVHLRRVAAQGHRYNGFNLLAMDGDTLAYTSNRTRGVIGLEPGVYGLSNHLLDTPWPKITGGKAELERLLDAPELRVADLLALLSAGRSRRTDALCADNESDLGRMQWRSSRFILGGAYGTRTSTVVLLDESGAGVFVERSFDSRGSAIGDVAYELGAGGISREIGRDSRLARLPV